MPTTPPNKPGAVIKKAVTSAATAIGQKAKQEAVALPKLTAGIAQRAVKNAPIAASNFAAAPKTTAKAAAVGAVKGTVATAKAAATAAKKGDISGAVVRTGLVATGVAAPLGAINGARYAKPKK